MGTASLSMERGLLLGLICWVFCCISVACHLWVVFLCRYGNVPFTKNPEKYIKYQVDQVGEMIEKLFDTSA